MADLVDLLLNEPASETIEKFRNLRYLSADLPFRLTAGQARDMIVDGAGEATQLQFPRNNEAVASTTSAPLLPSTQGHAPSLSLLHAETYSSIESGEIGEQPAYVRIHGGLDPITAVEVDSAVPAPALLLTLQETFRDVIFYGAYRLLNMRPSLSFDRISG